MSYDKLEKNLIDVIREQQAKLGYCRESLRLYYPLSSLNHFFSTEFNSEEMQLCLNRLPDSFTEKLGDVLVSHKGDRFCFHVPPQGSEYVHKNTDENEFIFQLVKIISDHGCTMNKILNLFHTYSEDIISENMANGEFDTMIRFSNDPDDTYYYCFKNEGCHISYHRFLPEDYAEFSF